MLLSQVEGFLETARHRNLSRAAEALHVTQPALTARIQSLDSELGTALFVRGRHGMDLTDAGRAFLPYAERAIERPGRRGEPADGASPRWDGELVLGAAPAVSTYVLPALLVRYARDFPNVRLVVRTGHSEEILELAVRREIDLGLVRELRHPDIEALPLYEDELVLVAAGSHRFGDRTTVGVHELEDARLILFDRTSSYYELTNAFFREAGVAPSGIMELDNIDAAKQMVGQGLGVALLPHTSVASELADGRLRAIDIEGAAPIRRRMVAIRRRDIGPPSGPVAGFLAVLDRVHEVLPASPVRDTSTPGGRSSRPPGASRPD